MFIFSLSVLMIVFSNYPFHGENLDLEKFIRHVVGEFGISGVIAIVIIFTIEKFNRDENRDENNGYKEALINDIKNNFIYAVYKRYIPEELLNEVENCVFRKSIYRKNYHLTYTLDTFNGDNLKEDTFGGEYIKFNVHSSYELMNMTDDEIDHMLEIHLERPVNENLNQHCCVNCVTVDGLRRKEQINNRRSSDGANLIFDLGKVTIPPRSSKSIMTTTQMVKRISDNEIWASLFPSDGIKVTFQYAKFPNLEIQAKTNHRIDFTEGQHQIGSFKTWELKRPIFPYQSIVIWWDKKDNFVPELKNA